MFDTFAAMKRVVVMLSKDEYEALLLNIEKIQDNMQYILPCCAASEIKNAAEEMAKILGEGEE